MILAQNERWRQVLGMQVERVKQGLALVDLVAHEWVTRGKLPFTGEERLETIANTAYARKGKDLSVMDVPALD